MSDETWEKVQARVMAVEAEAEAHGLYHRGWRFWPPYACFSCGEPINAHQFAFARACGSCDLGNSKTRRMLGPSQIFVAGKAVLEDPNDQSVIHPGLVPSHRRKEFPLLYRPRPKLSKPWPPPTKPPRRHVVR